MIPITGDYLHQKLKTPNSGCATVYPQDDVFGEFFYKKFSRTCKLAEKEDEALFCPKDFMKKLTATENVKTSSHFKNMMIILKKTTSMICFCIRGRKSF